MDRAAQWKDSSKGACAPIFSMLAYYVLLKRAGFCLLLAFPARASFPDGRAEKVKTLGERGIGSVLYMFVALFFFFSISDALEPLYKKRNLTGRKAALRASSRECNSLLLA